MKMNPLKGVRALRAGSLFILCAVALVIPLGVLAQASTAEVSPMMGLRPGGSRQIGGAAGFGAQAGGWFNPAIAGDVSAAPAQTETTPSPVPSAVDSVLLSAYKQWDSGTGSWLANLSWSGSSGPFTLVTSPYTDFHNLVTTLEKGVTSTGRVCTTDSTKSIECYEVSDGSTASVAVQGLGYEPLPAPTQPSFSNTGYWWNSTLDVSASYLDKIAAENLAHFYDRPMKPESVTASGDFATQATFRIPADARASYLRVEAGGRPSPASGFLDLIPPGITFGSINGMCWAPQDGFVYVADGTGGLIKQVDLFKVTPTSANVVTGVTNPMISKVSTGGMFVYVAGMAGATEVFAYTIGAGVAHYAYTTDTNFTRSITPAGIALLPGGSACFIADSSTGRIVKIPAGAGSGTNIVDNWGNYAWSLPVPCGIDADPIGYVNVGTNYGYIAKINTVGTGWTNNGSTYGTVPHAIEVDRDMNDGGSAPFVYSSAAFCEAFNRNAIEAVAGAGGGAAHYVGANVWDTGDGHLSVEPDWGYWVYPHYAQRVVINNNGMTSAQAAYPAASQTQDRITKITASGWPGRTLHLKLVDPPDFAPYSPDGGCLQGGCSQNLPYEGNDNQVDSGDVYGLTTDPNGQDPAPLLEMNLPFGSGDWTKDFYLKVPARYSGDNFRVEVSKVNPISGQVIPQKTVALSSLYTTWKRVLVERDHMFRRGGLLQTNANIDDTYVLLYKSPDDNRIDNLADGDELVFLDADSPAESFADVAFVATNGIDPNYPPPPEGGPHRVKVSLVTTRGGSTAYAMRKCYTASPPGADWWPNFGDAVGRCAGVGVINSNDGFIYDIGSNQINGPGSAFYDADMRDIEQPFDDAYVEFIGLRDGMGAVPYMAPSFFAGFEFAPGGSCTNILTQPVAGYDFAPMYRFGWLWFKNHGANNYIWLCGAGQTAPLDGCTVGCSGQYPMPQYLGLTAPASQQSYVFTGHHELYCSYTSNGVRENTNHELGHDFFVNPTASNQGHDNRCQWTVDGAVPCSTSPTACSDANTACLMNPSREIWTNRHRFDRYDLLCGDSGCPNGQSGCCSSCTIPGNGSVRQLNDPVQGVAP